MSDNQEAKPFAASGSGKSPEEVAFDLVNKLKGQGVWGEKNMPAILDMYAECLDTVRGLRAYSGQNRIEVPVRIGTPKKPATAPANLAAQSVPSQPVQPQQAQPVHPQHQPQAGAQPTPYQPNQAQPKPQVMQAQAVLSQAFHKD